MSKKKETKEIQVNSDEKIPDVDISNATDSLEEAMMELVYNEPFYANLVLNMRREFTTKFPTMAVNVTDEVNLFINPYFFMALSIPERIDVIKHECLSGDVLIDTDKGKLRIKDIVNGKLKVKVKSLSSTGKVEYKEVYDYSKKYMKNHPNKEWVSVKYTSNPFLYKTIICTNDHKIACVKDPLIPNKIDYVNAEDSLGCYSLRNVDISRPLNKERGAYNSEQLQVIVGCLLGDSHISNQGSLRSTGSIKHQKYSDHKQDILGGKVKKLKSGYTNKYTVLEINHGVVEQSKLLRELFYINETKSVVNILDKITPISLAYWFMDDGSWDTYGTSFLHTEGFSNEDQVLLVKMFKNKYDIEVEIMKRSHKPNLSCLKFKREATYKLFDLISPYMHYSMKYKIDPKYHNNLGSILINKNKLEYSLKKVTEVRKLTSKKSALYDISVRDNHNFFANNTLVHNCHHVINNHFVRFRDLEPKIYDEDKKRTLRDHLKDQTQASLLNQAADYAINEFLPNLPREVKIFDENGKALRQPEKIQNEKGEEIDNPDSGKMIKANLLFVKDLKKKYPKIEYTQNLEYYYEILKQKQEEDEKNGEGQGQGKPQMTLDDHGTWHEGDIDEEAITDKVKEIVNKTMEQTGDRAIGNLPSEVLQAIDSLNHVPKDWRSDVQRFVARSAEILIESTRKKRDRRYGRFSPAYPGKKIFPKLHLGIGFDASGSVGDEEVTQFFAEMTRIYNMEIDLTVIEFDSQVNAVYKFDPKREFQLHGRGGTAFFPMFEEAKKHELDGIIVFTDGGNWDRNEVTKPKFPVLWALLPNCDVTYDWGSKTSVEIKKRVRR